MTKFEEDLNKKMDLKEVPMYFTQSGCSITRKTYIETNWIFDNYKNWRSDEEFQELKEQYGNQADSILLMLEEISSLKSQLQQQALPVVPECVGEWVEKDKNYGRSVYDGLHRLDYEAGEIAPREVAKWVFDNKENLNQFTRAWLDGYTVEKPQLFKLIFPNSTAVLQRDGELNSFAARVYKRYLIENAMTEQEVKSIDERYWQFAVPVEDGE